jgi:hypothetical protein
MKQIKIVFVTYDDEIHSWVCFKCLIYLKKKPTKPTKYKVNSCETMQFDIFVIKHAIRNYVQTNVIACILCMFKTGQNMEVI